MKHSVLKAIKNARWSEASFEQSQKYRVWLTERGSSFGYGESCRPSMRSLKIMRDFAPVIFDALIVCKCRGCWRKKWGEIALCPYSQDVQLLLE